MNKFFFKSVKFWSFFEKIGKNHDFFMVFFLTPYFFGQKQANYQKNHIGHPNFLKSSPKKFIGQNPPLSNFFTFYVNQNNDHFFQFDSKFASKSMGFNNWIP